MIAFRLLALFGAFAIGGMIGVVGVRLRVSVWIGAPASFVICGAWMMALETAAEGM